MTTTAQIDAFLGCRRIGFAGASANPSDFSRTVFREFLRCGYDVVPIHPTARAIEARRAFATVVAVEPPLDAVFIMTPASVTERIVIDCHRAGVTRVWMHRGAGPGSVDEHAVSYARACGIDVIAGECPMMFLPTAGGVHRMHGQLRRATGRYPDDGGVPAHHPLARAAGAGVLAWLASTWAMLTIAGLFAWQTGMDARLATIPLGCGWLAWQHAGPGRLPPVATAAVFVAVGVALDLLVLALVADVGLVASWRTTWLPYAFGFATATAVGVYRRRPILAHATAA